MEDVQILKIGEKSYQIKDETARTKATNALNKINNIKLEGTYTSESETLTLSISAESTEQKGE